MLRKLQFQSVASPPVDCSINLFDHRKQCGQQTLLCSRFTRLLHVHIYAKLPNSIKLSNYDKVMPY